MTVQAEKEPRRVTPEEQAVQEVEEYLERVEKQPEVDKDVAGVVQATQPAQPQPVVDDQGQVVLQPARPEEPEIKLPLTEEEVRQGLHHKIIDSFRWLAEFCVYLIKKYPGRVFYREVDSSGK